MKVVIIGAGPAGLAAAVELQRMHHSVLIVEQDTDYVGGLSRTVDYKGFKFDIGGHRFFSKNISIVQWWRERLPNDFLRVKRRSRIYYAGKFFEYPLQPINALVNLGLANSIAAVLSYFWIRVFPIQPEESFEDWVSNRFGRRLFRTFFKTYTEKVWGIPCSQINADWASQRIKGLSLTVAVRNSLLKDRSKNLTKTLIDEFYYPRLGPGMMWETTRNDLVKAGVEFRMGRKVLRLIRRDDRITGVQTVTPSGERQLIEGDEFIVTMPLRDTVLGIDPPLPENVREAARALKYRDFLTVALILKGARLFEDNWIYIHDPEVRVGRIQNFNSWSAAMVPHEGVTCLGLEYFCSAGEALWGRPDSELIELASGELECLGLGSRSSVLDGRVVRMEKAYPVYDNAYKLHVKTIRERLRPLANLRVAGRNGMHKYNNQDHSMMTGILAARQLGGETLDPWNVNSDALYQESESDCSDSCRTIPVNTAATGGEGGTSKMPPG
jgi:protoporphyrinogen oxidase